MCEDGSEKQPDAAGRLPALCCCDWTSLHRAEGGARSWGGGKGQVIQGLASQEKEHEHHAELSRESGDTEGLEPAQDGVESQKVTLATEWRMDLREGI